MFVAIKFGSFGLLLPVYFTVAHRMFPFFAGNVVAGYRPWRPLWVLAAFWPLVLLHLALELVHAYAWLWLADLPLLALTRLLAVALVAARHGAGAAAGAVPGLRLAAGGAGAVCGAERGCTR